MIPQAALIADQAGVYVFVVEDGKAAIKRAQDGAESGADVVIDQGLTGGEQVIVQGLQGLRPGTPVQAAPLAERHETELTTMLSSIFVDRPRLAIVIAIVTTIAGALALFAIPVAQYPDIVPPQVSVTTFYPGANSAVVDATIAQPIEAQVVGVDKMIYMKSVSGDDGSYTLTVLLRARHRPRHQHRQRQQPRSDRAVQPAGRSAAAGRHRQEEVVRVARRYRGLLAQAHARSAVICPIM